jgi:hypothetical protein
LNDIKVMKDSDLTLEIPQGGDGFILVVQRREKRHSFRLSAACGLCDAPEVLERITSLALERLRLIADA